MALPEKEIEIKRRIAVLACIMVGVLMVCPYGMHGSSAARVLKGMAGGDALVTGFMIFGFFALAELLWRIVLVAMYVPVSGLPDELLPTCTVVVPAYNEGRQVFLTLESLAKSNYPKDKVQFVAVDDGSLDDTWKWIEHARHTLNRPVLTIRLPRNQGKRHALDAGFRKGMGEVLVTVDSDCLVEPDTLRNLVVPFVFDRNVGGVAGNVRVLNQSDGLIPKMVDVVFVYSFDFMRASQSMVRTVMCTPGALSAYRKSVVMNILDEWIHQQFLGQPANIGEDRAMTNLIIRQGYDVVFQQNARVYTQVPVTYSQLCKMYLRWARSNVRETLAMAGFIFTPFRKGSKLGARINLISDVMKLTKTQVFLGIAWGLILWQPAIFGSGAVMGIVLGSSLSAAIYAWKFGRFSSLLAFAYGFFFFTALSWIKPYALFTVSNSAWLTRTVPQGAPSHAGC